MSERNTLHDLTWIDPGRLLPFPAVERAMRDPDGLLAFGGDLSPRRLLMAYQAGVFPWYNQGQPILWWSPDPRSVLFPARLKISRSLRKTLRNTRYQVTLDSALAQVIAACAEPRDADGGTWITLEMQRAYLRLHELGHAHCVECWHDGELSGGLYGVAIGGVFFGESMFSRRRDASKIAFVHLVRQLMAWDFRLIDCQVHNPHLQSLGAERIARTEFMRLLEEYRELPDRVGRWRFDLDFDWSAKT